MSQYKQRQNSKTNTMQPGEGTVGGQIPISILNQESIDL